MRVLMYVPFLPPHLTAAVAEQARALRAAADRDGWTFRLLARDLDGGMPLPSREGGKPAEFVQGHPDDFQLLVAEGCHADVVYCPYPFGVLPPEYRSFIPAPVVFGVGRLFFDEAELGHTTDRYRREFRRVIASAAALVFGNEEDRRAAERYRPPAERCHTLTTDALPGLFAKVPSRPPLRQPATISKDQRIAWILTHGTLREAEVKLLRELGYEVWTTKQVHRHPTFRSGAGDPGWDDELSLPTDVLDRLNAHNFYEDPIPPDVGALLNGYFGTIMTDVYPEKAYEVLRAYQGRLLIRAFGREHPKTYTGYLENPEFPHIAERVRLYLHRVYFTPCYEQIIPAEGPMLKSRAVMLPLALPDRVLRTQGLWTGGDRRVLFVCPSIKTLVDYYGVIYANFKRSYSDLPHLIIGQQTVPVRDRNVVGYVSDEELRRLFREMQVMYYHSREPAHIHYHPLEAIVHGMPVVYMRGGLMEAFDTGSQAGACDTDEEARHKLKRVLAGDQGLIRAIQESQKTILEPFLPHNVRRVWEESFVHGMMGGPPTPSRLTTFSGPLLPPRRLTAASLGLSAVPDDLSGAMPLPTRELLDAPVLRPTTTAELRAGTEMAVPPKGFLGHLGRPFYMAWKLASLYASAAWKQGTLRPVNTGIRPYVPAWVNYFYPGLRYFYTRAERPFLDAVVPLRPDPLSPDALPRTPAFVLDPIGWLDSRRTDVPSLPLTVAYSRLPGEDDDGFDRWTPSVTAEARLWMRMARQVVFCCEEDRAMAVRRYGVEPIRTAVLPGGLLYGPIPEAQPVPGLPSRYWLACGGPRRRENVPPLREALGLLRRRGVEVPAVVWSAFAPSYPEKHMATGVEAVTLSDAQFQTAASGAEVVIVNARAGAEAARRVFHAALARVPVVAVDSPAVRAQWSEAEVRLVPPDDPVALADAVAAPADAVRIERAYRKAVEDGRRRAA